MVLFSTGVADAELWYYLKMERPGNIGHKKEDKYGPEAIKKEIEFKSTKIKKWALENNLVEGKDFKVIESIKNIETDDKSIAPHELRQFFVLIQEDNFQKFKEYFSGKYSEERKKENTNNKYGGPTLDYSWGGRFAVINDGVFFDIGIAQNLKEGQISAKTYHREFKEFFKQKAGFDFPTSEILNPILKEMSEKGLDVYKSVLEKLKSIKQQNKLPEDGYSLIDEIERDIMILEDAKNEKAVVDLPQILTEMPSQMRHYADLTYNIEDVKNLDNVAEITGISIPKEARIDKIFDRYGFDKNKMEEICKEFSESIYGS
jgi:hypothetical protein